MYILYIYILKEHFFFFSIYFILHYNFFQSFSLTYAALHCGPNFYLLLYIYHLV
jgi:hypothetical protein